MIPMGLYLSENVISEVEEFDLIENVLVELTNGDKRIETRPPGGRGRVLRFGHSYDEPHAFTIERPDWIDRLTLSRTALRPLDHHESIAINEYREGESIDSHIDSLAFEEQIGILSLGGRALLQFDDLSGVFTLPARSLCIFAKEAREMRHSLRCVAGPRWSIVFRKFKA